MIELKNIGDNINPNIVPIIPKGKTPFAYIDNLSEEEQQRFFLVCKKHLNTINKNVEDGMMRQSLGIHDYLLASADFFAQEAVLKASKTKEVKKHKHIKYENKPNTEQRES